MRAGTATIIMITCLSAAQTLSARDVPITTPMISADNGPMAIGAAMRQGAADAMRDIRAGKFRVLLLAETWQDENARMVADWETGYPIYQVAACEATECFIAAVHAYNDTMKDWHTSHK